MRTPILPVLSEECRRGIQRVADRHERELLELALLQAPDDFELLVRLGEIYPRLGRPEDGVKVDLRLVTLAPADPIVHYNLACSLALAGHIDAAFTALKDAIRLGYSDTDHLLRDADLVTLRNHPMFGELLGLLRRENN